MSYQLMTVSAFIQSYDRDVLALQDDPQSYINEVQSELVDNHIHACAFDINGNLVWPVELMKAHLQVQGEPQWPEPKPL